jgi:guanylate kinase
MADKTQKSVFVLIIGPSAVGKTTIVDGLLRRISGSARLITTTTRPRRPHEVHGRDYHFVTREEFAARERAGEFLETAETFGNWYGSSRLELENLLAGHHLVLGILDVKGARSARAQRPETVSIFVRPSSLEELRARMCARSVSTAEVERRMEGASTELLAASEFDYVVTNRDDALEETLTTLLSIITAHLPREDPDERNK